MADGKCRCGLAKADCPYRSRIREFLFWLGWTCFSVAVGLAVLLLLIAVRAA